jgi:hypothetical protein
MAFLAENMLHNIKIEGSFDTKWQKICTKMAHTFAEWVVRKEKWTLHWDKMNQVLSLFGAECGPRCVKRLPSKHILPHKYTDNDKKMTIFANKHPKIRIF